MIKVKYTVVPDGNITMDEVGIFETESYYGFYSADVDNYVIIAKADCDFDIMIIPNSVDKDDLGEVNQWMIANLGEMITGVAKRSPYKIVLEEK